MPVHPRTGRGLETNGVFHQPADARSFACSRKGRGPLVAVAGGEPLGM